jgi:DNA polymerase
VWREANPNIVKFWKQVDEAARTAIATKKRVQVQKGIGFEVASGMLFMYLPSGRRLSYPSVKMAPHPMHGGDAISFEGINSVTKKWERQFTYGGKLVENAIQAIARDCLAAAMHRVEASGYQILLTVHDELITQTAEGSGSAKELAEIVTQPIAWAPGLSLRASGESTYYYCK